MNSNLLQLVITQSWQIALLAITVAVLVRLIAKNRPHLSHALWLLVLLKCVTPPVWGQDFPTDPRSENRF